MIYLKRGLNEQYVNNYNADLIRCWREMGDKRTKIHSIEQHRMWIHFESNDQTNTPLFFSKTELHALPPDLTKFAFTPNSAIISTFSINMSKLPLARFLAAVAKARHTPTARMRSIPRDSPIVSPRTVSKQRAKVQSPGKKCLCNSRSVKKVPNAPPAKWNITNKLSVKLHITTPAIAMLIHFLKEFF